MSYAAHVAVRRIVALAALLVLSACHPDAALTDRTVPVAPATLVTGGEGQDALQAVLSSNAQVVTVAPALVPPGAPLPPFIEARLYAMANVAMHDALNAIVPRYSRYALVSTAPGGANPAAAVLTAARDVIVAVAPSAQGATDAWYAAELSALAGLPGVAEGIAVGQAAAAAIVARRAVDGAAGGGVGPYVPGPSPGDYQFTFPFNTPAFDFFGTGGFADGTTWGTTVAPFVVQSSTQFRAPAPYGATSNAEAVRSAEYTRDFLEVQALGCAACSARTAEQTEIAQFWVENSPTGWNRIARTLVAQQRLSAWVAARILALVQLAEFDAYLTTLESKYAYDFWRPVTAVARADSDGNPGTAPSPGWEVVAFPTPPNPDYPSAHASAGGAALAVLEATLPRRPGRFSTTSASLPGVTRSYGSVEQAAVENAVSRVYVGYHFRHATRAGLRQGEAVGRFVAASALSPTRTR